MGYVHGHWRETGWVRGHFRHPLRPGLDQVELVFTLVAAVRIDLSGYRAQMACCPTAGRPTVAVPAPRSPAESGGSGVPEPDATSGRAGSGV